MSSDIDTQLQRLLDRALASTNQVEVEQLLTECGFVLDQRVATAKRSPQGQLVLLGDLVRASRIVSKSLRLQ